MILYLFGGASDSTRERQTELVIEELIRIRPKQLLDIWFAIMNEASALKKLEDFRKLLDKHLPDCDVLNAGDGAELKRAEHPLIYVTGGESNGKLLAQIRQQPDLLNFIMNTGYYFGASAGAMITGARVAEKDGDPPLTGLSLLPSTVIEPHYSELKRKPRLLYEMKEWQCKRGIGLDEACGIVLGPGRFPSSYRTVGHGLVEVLTE